MVDTFGQLAGLMAKARELPNVTSEILLENMRRSWCLDIPLQWNVLSSPCAYRMTEKDSQVFYNMQGSDIP